MMLYKNTKVKFRSPDGNTDYFDIVAGVLQGDTLAPDLFIICLDCGLQMPIELINENGFTLAKEQNWRYPAQTITDEDYADDRALLTSRPTHAESLSHSLERVAGGVGLHINSDKTEYKSFNQRGNISTLKGGSLKLGKKFIYLGSSVLSTENDINTWLAKTWTANDSISVVWKSELSDKIKRSFMLSVISDQTEYHR